MDGQATVGVLAAGVIGSAYLWIGLIVLIEGNRRARITLALAMATLAVAAGAYSAFIQLLWPVWVPYHLLFVWWLAGLAAIAWYVVAMDQTFVTFSQRRVYLPKSYVLALVVGFGLGLIWQVVRADRPQALISLFGSAPALVVLWPLSLFIFVALSALGGALIILLRARIIYHRTPEIADRATDVQRWFIPTTVCAIGAVAFGAPSILNPRFAFPIVCAIIFMVSGVFFLFGAITSNRQLLGRPVRTRRLVRRGATLLGVTAIVLAIELDLAAGHRAELLGIALVAPLVAVFLDWLQYRSYLHDVEQYTRFIRDSTSGWPTFDPEAFHAQSQRIFGTLRTRLEPDACYMCIQPSLHDEPFVMEHGWNLPIPGARESKLYDLRKLELAGQFLGYIALRGPRGIAYSALELNFAESCAFSIANLYLDSRQAQAFATLVVQQNRDRYQHTQNIQRVLHDQVNANLDVILKNVRMLPIATLETSEIADAAQESMTLIRDLVRGQLADLYPSALQRRGLLAALSERVAYYKKHNEHVELVFEASDLDDERLNLWLSEDLRRTAYGALDEVIRNAVKYAGGTADEPVLIRVTFFYDDSGLTIEVEDNGVGFVPELAVSDSGGTGLHYQHAALQFAGALMVIDSDRRRGTRIRIFLPSTILRMGGSTPYQLPSRIAYSPIEWARMVLATERHRGGRLLINDLPSDLTRPPSTMVEYYRSHARDEGLVKQFIEIDERRQQIFAEQLQEFPFVELIDRQRLQRYIQTGMTDDNCQSVGAKVAQEHVRKIVELLHTQRNYHLGLSDEVFGVNIAIKPHYAVMLEERPKQGQVRLDWHIEGLCDTNSLMVSEYTRRFRTAWVAVPVQMRRKEPVIDWLEEQLRQAY